MKTKLYILAAAVVILVCTCIAIVVANDRTSAKPVDGKEVSSLKSELKKTQDQQRLHDAVNETAIKNAGDQIITLTNQKNVLCNQIKAARLVQPLCQ